MRNILAFLLMGALVVDSKGRGTGGQYYDEPYRNQEFQEEVYYEQGSRSNYRPGDPIFPPDLFSPRQLKRGYILFYIIGMDFMLIAAAFANDHFVVAALEVIASKIPSPRMRHIVSSPVISMARSFPKFNVMFMGTFLAFSDIGFGTIVGSMAFHTTITVACFLFTSNTVPINWSILFRDFIFFILAMGTFFSTQLDNLVKYTESVSLPGFYIFIFLPIVFLKDKIPFLGGGSDPEGANQIVLSNLGEVGHPDEKSQTGQVLQQEQPPKKMFPSPPDGSCSGWCVLNWLVYIRVVVPGSVVWATLFWCDPRRKKDSPLCLLFCCFALLLGSLWVILACYPAVWFATVYGETKGFPPEVMGFSQLAVFFSMPTTIHVVMAKDISNLFGELLTDVCFAYMIPALLYYIVLGKPMEVSSDLAVGLLLPVIFAIFSVTTLRCCGSRGLKICSGVFYVLSYIFLVLPFLFALEYKWIHIPI